MNKLLRKKSNELTKKKKGFTLVELIIVIAIIAILAAIAIPKFGSIRGTANHNADVATAKNIATIVAAKISDNTLSDTQSGAPDDLVAPDGTTAVDITDQIDGGISPKVEPATNTEFFVVATNGNITIRYNSATGTKIYPQD